MSTIEEKIAAAVESRSQKIVQTLSELVRYPSIVKADPRDAGPGERDCQLYLKGRLETLGFRTDLWDQTGLPFTPNTKAVRAPTRDAPLKAAPISAGFSKVAEADVRSC